MISPHQESRTRQREQILERILQNTGPVFALELGLVVLLLGGADRTKLLKRIERHLIKPEGCF